MNGGPLVTAPKIVTVTWSADPNAAALEAFDDQLGASAYWKTTVGEYGIGAATSGAANHVRVTSAPPAASTAEEVEAFVAARFAARGRAAQTDKSAPLAGSPVAAPIARAYASTCLA